MHKLVLESQILRNNRQKKTIFNANKCCIWDDSPKKVSLVHPPNSTLACLMMIPKNVAPRVKIPCAGPFLKKEFF